jgi:type II secretory pathway pseudopilin PulG
MWQYWRELYLPAAIGLSTVAALGYVISRFRQGRTQITVLDALQIVVLMAIVAGTIIPIMEAVSSRAKQAVLIQDLSMLRSYIALYKAEHGDDSPVLYEGTLPQLLRPTNALGELGPPGSEHPFGPYLHEGVPQNPFTGKTVITAAATFPPAAASGQGGWLYHQESGQIAADLPDMLAR